jgi:uroporphyrin-III C-methyltransferase / precorrin-2 dehydrogenase / sirohydrochlorin ferrochelatase
MDATLSPLNKRQGKQSSGRVSELAKLPVFWDLQGKRVVVAGGSEGAAWKAELLAACGAIVHIYADKLTDVFASLVGESPAPQPRCYIHHARACTAADMKDASLAIGDFESEADAELFLRAGVAAGTPVNVIDKPAFCQFQFGSIVNRSPVIVSISTDGAAPVLAQAIRRRIEAILPASLQLWGKMAQGLRDRVNDRLESGQARRRFWEGFVDKVFTCKPDGAALAELLADAAKGDGRASRGKVTFVAAGLGDPELLTLKAIRALQAADIVLFGTQVSNEILEFARREAHRIPVDRLASQAVDRITAFLGEGKNIVRIDLSDTVGTHRFREEITRLKSSGVRVATIPGVAESAEVLRYAVTAVPFAGYASAGQGEQLGGAR